MALAGVGGGNRVAGMAALAAELAASRAILVDAAVAAVALVACKQAFNKRPANDQHTKRALQKSLSAACSATPSRRHTGAAAAASRHQQLVSRNEESAAAAARRAAVALGHAADQHVDEPAAQHHAPGNDDAGSACRPLRVL